MLLKELSEAFGVSGEETAVRKIILDAIKAHVSAIEIDTIGNLTAIKKGTGDSSLRLMLAAHMDEVGFMVTGYDNNGLLRFANIGGIDERILPGLRVRIGQEHIPGVVLWPPIHVNRDQNVKKLKDLRIDVGAASKGAAEGKAKPGTRITFDSNYAELSAAVVRGKAFDDRVGCSLLVDILQGGPYPLDIVAAFTVQEEIGLRGGQVAAQRLNPNMALVLETTPTFDVPDPDAEADDLTVANPGSKLGQGPALTVMDRSMITPPRLLNFLRETAESHHIPYQLKTALGGGTDAGRIHLSNAGVPSAVISVPCRYIHSPAAYMNTDDYANALKLLQSALQDLTPALLTPATT